MIALLFATAWFAVSVVGRIAVPGRIDPNVMWATGMICSQVWIVGSIVLSRIGGSVKR